MFKLLVIICSALWTLPTQMTMGCSCYKIMLYIAGPILFAISLRSILENYSTVFDHLGHSWNPYNIFGKWSKESFVQEIQALTKPWTYDQLLRQNGWTSHSMTTADDLHPCHVKLLLFTNLEETSHNIKDILWLQSVQSVVINNYPWAITYLLLIVIWLVRFHIRY